jgi:fused signal recognition particle receptor
MKSMVTIISVGIGLGLGLVVGVSFFWSRFRKSKKPLELSSDLPSALSETLDTREKLPQSLLEPLQGWLSRFQKLDASLIEDLETVLLTADVGLPLTESLIAALRRHSPQDVMEAREILYRELMTLFEPSPKFTWTGTQEKPQILYLMGVNGVGKTTTLGKLAAQAATEGHKVVVIAADTFRAAAGEQLAAWCERSGVMLIRGSHGADPSSVIHDGLLAAKARKATVVLVDTAGRLQTKTHLMQELSKMVRVCERVLERGPDGLWLVIDATTGQNGLKQACEFNEAAPLNGVVLTKFDASAKGGILLAIRHTLKLPVYFLGLGEGLHDLVPFSAERFVKKLLGTNESPSLPSE